MEELMLLYVVKMGISSSHNTRRIFMAWDEVSGVNPDYVLKRFFKEGKLYITLKSSVLCSHLSMQKASLIERINKALEEDVLFIKNEPNVGFVKELILR